jgi:DEAD/DEAH box helicase domain-containing protein
MSIEDILDSLKSDLRFKENTKIHYEFPSRNAEFSQFPENLHPAIIEALQTRGIHSLYSHQKTAWDEVKKGNHIVVVTGTASGKSLCYNLPVLDRFLRYQDTAALYLFPTKALTQDQYNTLSNLSSLIGTNLARSNLNTPPGYGVIPIGIYDGDTANEAKNLIRAKSRIVLSNPDMLHMGILPHHTAWSGFFSTLKFIIIDEIHTYRGVFGSHLANVLRRLKRILNFYNSNPIYILTSATIANPVEFAEKLTEKNFFLIENDGSSKGNQQFLVYSPPVINEELGLRRSPLIECMELSENLVLFDLQSIIFCRSRPSVELLLSFLHQHLSKYPGYVEHKIRGYRSGYLPLHRREIETGLKNGIVRIVVATNALELGIDIGGVDVVIMVGYPGTIAATRQQAGRAGRGQTASIAILITTSDPIDQFLAKNPNYLFIKSPESALINPDNLLILLHHLRCSLFELPFSNSEGFGNIDTKILHELFTILVAQGYAYHSGSKFFYTSDQYPSKEISLRNNSSEQIVLQITGDETQYSRLKIIGKIDYLSAFWMVHPGAVYFHEAQTFLVQELNLEQKYANLREQPLDYYTVPRRDLQINITDVHTEVDEQIIIRGYGDIIVTSQVIGFKKIRWYTNEQLATIDLDLPPTELSTMGYWIGLKENLVTCLRNDGLWTNDRIDYGKNWLTRKDEARYRDQYRCQICGMIESGRAHDVHHKVPFRMFQNFEQANRLDNLVTLCHECHRRVEQNVRLRSGLSGLAFLLVHLAPIFLMCDIRDIGVHSDAQPVFLGGRPSIVIYEEALGGLGFSKHLFDIHHELIKQAYLLVKGCDCKDGCPSCVGPGGENGAGSKNETIAILEALKNHANTK